MAFDTAHKYNTQDADQERAQDLVHLETLETIWNIYTCRRSTSTLNSFYIVNLNVASWETCSMNPI